MAFYNIDNQVKRRQMELAEKEQRLANDPGHIFMKSLASSAPQQLMRALGSVGVNLAKGGADYALFGGKEEKESVIRTRETGIGERNPALRKQIYAEQYPGTVSKPSSGAMELVKTAEDVLKPSESLGEILETPKKAPSDLDQILSADPEIKEPETIYIGGGEYAVEVPSKGMSAEQMKKQGLITDPTGPSSDFTPGGKVYRVLTTEQMVQYKDNVKKQAAQRKAAQGQPGELDQILSPDLPAPSEIKQPAAAPAAIAAPGQARRQPEPMSSQVPLSQVDAGADVPLTSKELLKEEELQSLERRKNADLTQSQRKKRQDLLKAQYSEQIKQAHNFLALTSPEELAEANAKLQDAIDRERDPIVRELLQNAKASYPTESDRKTAQTMFENNEGTVRIGSVSIGERGKVTFNYNEKPKRVSHLDAVKRNQSQITRNQRVIDDLKSTDQERNAAMADNVKLRKSNRELANDDRISGKIPLDDDDNLIALAGEETTIGSPSSSKASQRRLKKIDLYRSNRSQTESLVVNNKKANEAFTSAYNANIAEGMSPEAAREYAIADVTDDGGNLLPAYKAEKKTVTVEEAYPHLFGFSKKSGIPRMTNKLINEGQITAAELVTINAYAQDKNATEVEGIIRKTIELKYVPGAKKNRAQQVIGSK